jgi:hypothetical protein
MRLFWSVVNTNSVEKVSPLITKDFQVRVDLLFWRLVRFIKAEQLW